MIPAFTSRSLLSLAAWLGLAANANCATTEPLPIQGRPVPQLTAVDAFIRGFMEDDSRNIQAGVVGISRGGRCIYLRAFGWLRAPVSSSDSGTPLPETALMRLASVSKVITAATIHELDSDGTFGPQGLNRKAFDLNGNGGILGIVPIGAPPAGVYADISLRHLLGHAGGFRRTDDPFGTLHDIANALGTPSPPTRQGLIRWRLGQPLADTPGAQSILSAPAGVDVYSNFGYHVLGEIAGTRAADGYLGFVSRRVLSPEHWIPSTEWAAGESLQANTSPREPHYQPSADGATEPSVFPPYDQVPTPYGPFSLHLGLTSGGLIASAQAMLAFGNLYHCGYTAATTAPMASDHMGSRIISATNPMIEGNNHTGGFQGTNTVIVQHPFSIGQADDVVIYIAFSRIKPGEATAADPGWDMLAHNGVMAALNALPAGGWPMESCDGLWMDPGGTDPSAGSGGYDRPFQTFQGTLNRVAAGSSLRLKPGSVAWTGTIAKRLRLDAPEGPVTLGQQ